MIDELSALSVIKERFHNTSSDVELGIGDDCAAVRFDADKLVLSTTDIQVEDVHFVKSLISPAELARKAVAVSVSDIGAMGGVPKYILISAGLTPDEDGEYLNQLISGFQSAQQEFRVEIIGGNLSSSDKIFLDITVLGDVEPDLIVKRKGAKPGDIIFVSGTLGDSALGLSMIKGRDSAQDSKALIDRHLHPIPRLQLGRELAVNRIPTSMIDVSDGLLLDLERITVQQNLGAVLELDKVPTSIEYKNNVRQYYEDDYRPALGGGEDYELLFTANQSRRSEIEEISKKLDVHVTEIGTIKESASIEVVTNNGEYRAENNRGYVHFGG